MSIVSGLQSGLTSGLRTGINPSAAVAGYSIDTLTPAQIATITGQAAPTLMWLGKDASGATELVAGTDNLTDEGGGILKEVDDATLGGLTTQFVGTTDLLTAAGSGVADIGVETMTIILIDKFPATATGQVISKRDTSFPNNGYEIISLATTGNMAFYTDSASGQKGNTIVGDHMTGDAQVIAVTRQSGANLQGIWSRIGSSTGTRNNQTMTNAVPLKIGRQTYNTTPANFCACMIWIGTDGDFGAAADFVAARSAIAVALGYE